MSDLIDREAVRLAKVPYDEQLSEYERGWNDACEAIADNVPAASPWHRVEKELPSMDDYDWVLGIVTGEAGYLRFHKAVMMVSFDPQYKEWFIDEYPDARITVSHWMLLPDPPKEDA